jgi:hypothetical protein
VSAILGDIVTRLAVDRREWTNGLSQSARDAAKFGNSVTGELRTVEKQIAALSRAYAAGAKVNKAELDALAARHQSLTRQIEAGKALANNLLGRGSDLPGAGPSAASLRVRRTEEQQLARVRTLLQEVAAEEVRTGQSRATQIERLVRLEGSLASAIERRKTLVERARDAQFVGPMPVEAAAQSVASQRVRRSEEEQLKRVRQLIGELATEEARTGESRAHQIDRLIRLESQLIGVKERAKSLEQSRRDAAFIGPMPAATVAPSIASQRVGRSDEQMLAATRARMAELAEQYARTGQVGSHQLERLARLENALAARIAARGEVLEAARREALRDKDALYTLADSSNVAGRAATDLSSRYSRTTMAMLELSRGVEDAAVVYGTSGLAGSIRASANNLAAFATVIHPIAGVVTGVGAAIGSILIPKLLESGEAAKKAKKDIDEWAESFTNIDRVSRDHARFRVEREDAKAGMRGQNAAALSTTIVAARRDAERLAIEESNIRSKRAAILASYGLDPEFAQGLTAPVTGNATPALSAIEVHRRNNPGTRDVTEDDREKLKELDRQLDDVASRQSANANRIEDAQAARRIAAEGERKERLKKEREEWEKTLVENRREREEREKERESLAVDVLTSTDPMAGELAAVEQRRRQRLAMIDELSPDNRYADALRRGVNDAAEVERTRIQREMLGAQRAQNQQTAETNRLLQRTLDEMRAPVEPAPIRPVF